MELILLGGNNNSNQQWTSEVADTLKDFYSSTTIQQYNHWSEEKGSINLQTELEDLIALTKTKKEYCICAKSVGSILALKACAERLIFPQYCVFIGVAYSWAEKNGLDMKTLISKYNIPTLIIQKTSDPAISVEELKEVLKDKDGNIFTLQEIPGDNHNYDDLDQLKDLIYNYKMAE